MSSCQVSIKKEGENPKTPTSKRKVEQTEMEEDQDQVQNQRRCTSVVGQTSSEARQLNDPCIKTEQSTGDDIACPVLNGMDLNNLDYHHYQNNILIQRDDGIEAASDHASHDEFDSDISTSSDESENEDDKSKHSRPVTGLYSESQEPWPPFPIYHQSMPALTERIFDIPKRVIDLIDGLDENSRCALKQQRRYAEECQIRPDPKRVRIAILGDAGKGKSSLINSLTDIDDLARSLSGGASCTCVPTEYQGPFKGQTGKFAAQIIFYADSQIKASLHEIVHDYCWFHFESNRDWSTGERELYQKRAHNAFEMIYTLFHGDILGDSKDAVKKHLHYAYPGNIDAVEERMLAHCISLLKSRRVLGDGTRLQTIEAGTVARLRHSLDPLTTSTSRSNVVALWPLVRQVRIGVKGPRVLESCALIDLPGISDTNQIRARNCTEYIQTCDEIWAVSTIARVVDDSSIFHMISKYGKIFKGKVAVIATCSDEGINQKLATSFQNDGIDLKYYCNLELQLKSKQKFLAKLKKEKKKREKALTSKYTDQPDMKEELYQLVNVMLPQAEKEVADISAQSFECLTKVRTDLVTAGLLETFREHMPEGKKLPVFCVSNSHYENLKVQRSPSPHQLPAEATGIPGLRGHLLGLPAPGLCLSLDSVARQKLGQMLQDLGLWLEKPLVPFQDDLQQNVKELQHRCQIYAVNRLEEFVSILDSIISKPLQEKLSEFHEHALKIVSNKRTDRHPGTIRAFLRHDGNWGTQVCQKESWNEQMSRLFVDTVKAKWPLLEKEWQAISNKHLKALRDDLNGVIGRLNPDQVKSYPIDRFQKVLQRESQHLGTIWAENAEIMKKQLRNFLMNISVDSETNMFTNSMKNVYAECRNDSGDGVTNRSMDKLTAHFKPHGSVSPFVQMKESIYMHLKDCEASNVNHRLAKEIATVHQTLLNSFAIMLKECAVKPSEKLRIQEELGFLDVELKNILQALEGLWGQHILIKPEEV